MVDALIRYKETSMLVTLFIVAYLAPVTYAAIALIERTFMRSKARDAGRHGRESEVPISSDHS